MKSKTLNTTELTWHSSLELISKNKKPSSFIENLKSAGIHTLHDLLWILPLRIHKTPENQPFYQANLNEYFKGSGKILHCEIRPAFGRRGKGNILLYNGFVVVQDNLSTETMTLRWFNLYPNQKKQIEQLDQISFLGVLQEYKTQKQIISPQILSTTSTLTQYILEYPTVNKVPGTQIKKIVEMIPQSLWKEIPQAIPSLGYDKDINLTEAFSIIHGRYPSQYFNQTLKTSAEERLIYEEFLEDQLKILTRRKQIKKKKAQIYDCSESLRNDLFRQLPFKLTIDQEKVLNDIRLDLSSGMPMMRMIQGDVGCGKTIIAYLASEIVIRHNAQVALMCPTEALAQQHFESFTQLNPNLKIKLLLGSTKTNLKKEILNEIKTGETSLIIGTHSLFQDSVIFKNLGLAIIDEQHKFGVEQRLKLISKGKGTHSLIMTATPIPRTLSLAQFGDLDISTIKTMPSGRIPIKTRITEKINYPKYIDFIKGRLSMGEQAYFVFPAIEESETLDLQNVKEGFDKYLKIFSSFSVEMLHGQMKSDEKEEVIKRFKEKKVQILISTSVIEVGLNIPNATIMSIYSPDRFVDGFVIAQEDLRFRGEGDLFGVEQSGTQTSKKLANLITHGHILEKVIQDLSTLSLSDPAKLSPHFERLAKDQKILDTI